MASRRRVDDSDEAEEATALDLRPSSRSARPADLPQPPIRKPMVPVAAKRPVVDDSSEDDGEATEFLSVRPPSKGPSPASPRALPSSAPSMPSTAPTAEPRGHRRAVPLAAPPTAPSPSPQQSTPMSTDPSPSPSPRPLPQRSLDSTTGHTATSSVPRVTRININDSISSTGDHDVHGMIRADDDDVERTLPPDEPQQQMLRKPEAQRPRRAATAVDIVDDETQAPELSDPDHTMAPGPTEEIEPPQPPPVAALPRRLPLTAEGEPMPARAPTPQLPRPRAPQPAAPEQHDGILVVEAPADANVTVNGVDRGRGVVRVADLDRDARHAVRIHAPGFQPWSGSVSLQGKPAAKIKPALKPRAR